MRYLIFVPWAIVALLALSSLALSPASPAVPARAAAPTGGAHLFPAWVDAGSIH